MNFWVIISYLKVKNLSRNVAPEKCKKKQPKSPLQSLPGETKTAEQLQQKQASKKTQKQPEVGTMGTPFLYCL